MITAKQLKAARLLLRITQEDLARGAEINIQAVKRMETLGPERLSSGPVDAVTNWLGDCGIEF